MPSSINTINFLLHGIDLRFAIHHAIKGKLQLLPWNLRWRLFAYTLRSCRGWERFHLHRIQHPESPEGDPILKPTDTWHLTYIYSVYIYICIHIICMSMYKCFKKNIYSVYYIHNTYTLNIIIWLLPRSLLEGRPRAAALHLAKSLREAAHGAMGPPWVAMAFPLGSWPQNWWSFWGQFPQNCRWFSRFFWESLGSNPPKWGDTTKHSKNVMGYEWNKNIDIHWHTLTFYIILPSGKLT